ncbi:MAG: CoA pyrophosphatase [Acidobacteriota bacterium]
MPEFPFNTTPSRPSALTSGLTGSPELDRAALLDIVRGLPRLALLDPGPSAEKKDWLRTRIGLLQLLQLPQLNDGHRLPGREGRTTPAAVLIPIVNRPDGLTLLLTQRSDTLPDHPGQISFPGGRQESADQSSAHTALRESAEEIGLDQRHVEIFGQVGRYETVTGYAVTPVIGWIEPPFEIYADPVEVAEVFEVPLSYVLNPGNFVQRHREVAGKMRHFFACTYQERYIWGATAAMILLLHYALAAPLEQENLSDPVEKLVRTGPEGG